MKTATETFRVIAVVLMCIGAAKLSADPGGLKKRIAVLDFTDKTGHRMHWWRTGQNVGQGMTDMLTTELVKSKKYTVIERSQIDKIMKEQALGASGAVTQQTAAKIGKLLGVEIAIFGAVTEFGYSKEKKKVNAPVSTPLGKLRGLKLGKQTARVAIDVRFVNTSTGEILAAENIAEEESKGNLGISLGNKSFENQTKFDESMVGKATRKAIVNIVKLTDKQMENVTWRGRVVKATGSSIIVNAGSATGIKIGDELIVYSKGEELIDPETGLSLGSDESEVGTIKVESDIAGGKASKCSIVSGSGGSTGDIVRYPK
jgi:curli biogenesis system outer membrane secretion channel CsgG